jgi:hypothetical protein
VEALAPAVWSVPAREQGAAAAGRAAVAVPVRVRVAAGQAVVAWSVPEVYGAAI